MVVVEQDKEKEKEQVDNLEDLRGNSYRLSKTGQDHDSVRRPPASACVRLIPKFSRTDKT
jgi:hypothetical protein